MGGRELLALLDNIQAGNVTFLTAVNNASEEAETEEAIEKDMFAKCQYLDELTGGKGVTFATGTPVSNSMVELYTIMRYLQYDTLQKMGLSHFDDWAASFGETVTAIELSPEGTGYRAKTRFARFFNLPELISLFKESADVQTADMLNLPVPQAEYINEVLKPSETQEEMVSSFADRAEAVRNGNVNMEIGGKVYTERKEAGAAIIEACKALKAAGTEGRIGSYGAFELHSRFDNFDKVFRLSIKGAWNYSMEVGKDPQGNILRVTNALAGIERALPQVERRLENLEQQLVQAKEEAKRPFAQEAELAEKSARLAELNSLLNIPCRWPAPALLSAHTRLCRQDRS